LAITKRLITLFENQRPMSSEELFDRYRKGHMSSEVDLSDYLAIRAALGEQLHHAA